MTKIKLHGLGLFLAFPLLALSPIAVLAQTQTAPLATSVPAGTIFEAKLQEDLATNKNHDQDHFLLREHNPLLGGNPLLNDAQIEGHLEEVVKAAKGKKAKMHLVFDDIILKDGARLPLDATLLDTKIETETKGTFLRNTGLVVGGAVAGHYLGKKTGLPAGTLGGAAAASAVVLNSPGGEVVVKRGTTLKLKLNKPLDISAAKP
jgi:hypothetical protein